MDKNKPTKEEKAATQKTEELILKELHFDKANIKALKKKLKKAKGIPEKGIFIISALI